MSTEKRKNVAILLEKDYERPFRLIHGLLSQPGVRERCAFRNFTLFEASKEDIFSEDWKPDGVGHSLGDTCSNGLFGVCEASGLWICDSTDESDEQPRGKGGRQIVAVPRPDRDAQPGDGDPVEEIREKRKDVPPDRVSPRSRRKRGSDVLPEAAEDEVVADPAGDVEEETDKQSHAEDASRPRYLRVLVRRHVVSFRFF